jgi:hypothetical protein
LETLSVLDPDVAMDAGLNEEVAPAGNPLTLSDTVPAKPAPAATVAVNVVPPPCTTVREAGDAEREKSGGTG